MTQSEYEKKLNEAAEHYQKYHTLKPKYDTFKAGSDFGREYSQAAYNQLMKDAIKLKSIISLASGCAKIDGNGPLEKLLDNAITGFDKKYPQRSRDCEKKARP